MGSKYGLVAMVLIVAGCGGDGAAPVQDSPAASTAPVTTSATTLPPATTAVGTTTEAVAPTSDPPAVTSTSRAVNEGGDDAPPGPTVTTSEPQPDLRPVTPDEPLRVWVIGDSLAGPLGEALRHAVAGVLPVEVRIEHEGGTGLARPDLFDWPELIAERLPIVAPDVVVIHIGANDAQTLRSGSGWWEFGTAEWIGGYHSVVGATMDLILEGATRLYWVGAPIMASTHFSDEMVIVNTIFQEETARREAVHYIDAFDVFRDADGGYAAALPGPDGEPVTVRQPDGVHYTAEGAGLLARHVLAAVAADWGLSGPSG